MELLTRSHAFGDEHEIPYFLATWAGRALDKFFVSVRSPAIPDLAFQYDHAPLGVKYVVSPQVACLSFSIFILFLWIMIFLMHNACSKLLLCRQCFVVHLFID